MTAEIQLREPAGATMPAVAEFQMMREMAEAVCKTEFVPQGLRNKPDATLAAIMYGREMGLGAMQAMSRIHMIDGHPTMGAELMLAMIRRAGHKIIGSKLDDKGAEITGQRGDTGEQMTVSFGIDDAMRARAKEDGKWMPLAETGRYKQYPQDMFWARCVSRLGRRLCSDALYGVVYTPEDFGVSEEEAVEASGYITAGDITEAGVVPGLTGLVAKPETAGGWGELVKQEILRHLLMQRPKLEAWKDLDDATRAEVVSAARSTLAAALATISVEYPAGGGDLPLTEDQAVAVFEAIKAEDFDPDIPIEAKPLSDQALEDAWWTEIVGLCSLPLSKFTGGRAEDIETRTRTLYRLMKAVGLWPGTEKVDRLHLDLAAHLAADPEQVHWSDLGVKAQQKTFAEKVWKAAQKAVTDAGKELE